MRSFKKQNGFTLVAAIVSMGILGLVAIGFMRMTKMQSKSSKYYETRSNEHEIINNVRLFLRDREACENTFSGIVAPNNNRVTPLNSIKTASAPPNNPNGFTVFETNNPKKYGLKSITMNLTNPFNVGANVRGPFVLEVDFVRSDNAIGMKEKKEEVLIDIQTGPAIPGLGFNIMTCFTDGENSINTAIKTICEQAGGLPVEIFDPTAIMENGGVKWRCEFFDLYLGQHNKKQCKNLQGGADVYPIDDPTHCRVFSNTDGWDTATSSWTPYNNYFSATPKGSFDCQDPDEVEVGAKTLTIADYRALQQPGGATFANYNLASGRPISNPCPTEAPLNYADHPDGAQECEATCAYINEDTGLEEPVQIPRPMNITSRGFY